MSLFPSSSPYAAPDVVGRYGQSGFDAGPPGKRPFSGVYAPRSEGERTPGALFANTELDVVSNRLSKMPRLGVPFTAQPIVTTQYVLRPWAGAERYHDHVVEGDVVYVYNGESAQRMRQTAPEYGDTPLLHTLLNHAQLSTVLRNEWTTAAQRVYALVSQRAGHRPGVLTGPATEADALATLFGLPPDAGARARARAGQEASRHVRALTRYAQHLDGAGACQHPLIDVSVLEDYARHAVVSGPGSAAAHGSGGSALGGAADYEDYLRALRRTNGEQMRSMLDTMTKRLDAEGHHHHQPGGEPGNDDDDGDGARAAQIGRVLAHYGAQMSGAYMDALESFLEGDMRNERAGRLLYDVGEMWCENLAYLSPALVYDRWSYAGVVVGHPNRTRRGATRAGNAMKAVAVAAYGQAHARNIFKPRLMPGDHIVVSLAKHYSPVDGLLTHPELVVTVSPSQYEARRDQGAVRPAADVYVDALTGQRIATQYASAGDYAWCLGSVQHMEAGHTASGTDEDCLVAQGRHGYARSISQAYEARDRMRSVALQVRQQ